MKKIFKLFIILSFVLLYITACEDEFQQPYNVEIESSDSGLEGIWEGIELRKDFAKQLLDSLGNTVTDEKNRTVWYDTSVVVTGNEWSEFIEFQILPEVDSFAISNNADSLNQGVILEVINMPLSTGYWAVTETINPEGEKPDVRSVTFYDPEDPHNSLSSIVWTIKEQGPDEITLQYSFGSASYDTLFTKTFKKL